MEAFECHRFLITKYYLLIMISLETNITNATFQTDIFFNIQHSSERNVPIKLENAAAFYIIFI